MKDRATLALEVVALTADLAKERTRTAQQRTKIRSLEGKLVYSQSRRAEAERLNRAFEGVSFGIEELSLIRDQAAQLDQLKQENEGLQAALDDARRKGFRQAHPFGRDLDKEDDPAKATDKKKSKRHKKKAKKKPGRRPGKGPFAHRAKPDDQDISQTHQVDLDHCPCCNGSDLNDIRQHQNYQIDFPLIQAEITRFFTQSAMCNSCNERVQSRHDDQLSQAVGAASTCLGPRLIGMAADMHVRLGMSYEKVADALNNMLRLKHPITRAALCQNVLRLGQLAAEKYQSLIAQLQAASVVHADETGWRIGSKSAWLWVFTNARATIYLIREGKGARGHEAVLEILGRKFAGTLVSDCFVAYDHHALAAWAKQKCFSHLLKDLSQMSDAAWALSSEFIDATSRCLRAAMALKAKRATLNKAGYDEQCAKLEERLDKILESHADTGSEDAARFLARLVKHRAHLFTFLYADEVDATNNLAERQVRPAVIVRKTQGCNKSADGAEAHARLASLLATARQRGESTLDCLTEIVYRRLEPA